MVRVNVPGLGQIPVNAMAACGLAIVGFVEPSIWLAGLGLEAAVVSALAFNPRFQKVIDARSSGSLLEDASAKRISLIAALPSDLQARLSSLQQVSARVLSIYHRQGIDPELTSGTRSGLDKLEWIFLKLLIARDHLENELGSEKESKLQSRIATLQDQNRIAGQSPALQRSQEAIITILQHRLENLRNRDRLLSENESDLCRIEAQVELMKENAAIEGKPKTIDTEIELASDLASPDLFGIHSGLVRDLETVETHSR